MHFRPRLSLRRILSVAGLLSILSALIIFAATYRSDEHLFANLTEQLFLTEMTANTLNMHYTLAYPSDFGIQEYETILPCYSLESHISSQFETENLISSLNALDPDNLSTQDAFTRALLLESLENSLFLGSMPYYEEPLSPASGMQSQLPILLAEYTFRCKRDVEDYLAILDQTDEYFDALLTFEQEKANAGYLMPSVSVKKVIEQCDTILTKEELDAGTHFLQVTFTERLAPLLNNGIITANEADTYQAQNNRLLRTVMLPAYIALGDGLLVLEDPTIAPQGLASKPGGDIYYSQLLFSQTGSLRTIAEIKAMLTARFNADAEAIRQLILETPSLALDSRQTALQNDFPYKEADEMLIDLQTRMQEDFPALDTGNGQPTATVKAVSASLQDYCAPAFYLTPPLDDTSSNAIYINEKSTPAGLELYTTLAHEGYPGHMYQTVYHNQNMMSMDTAGTANVRELLWYGGYLEGWALYVEFIAYDYAAQLYTEREMRSLDAAATDTAIHTTDTTNNATASGPSDQEDASATASAVTASKNEELAAAVQLAKHDRSLLLCLYSLLDIMIHYENASMDQIGEVLSPLGITSKSTVQAIYEYIVEEPTNYLKYYLGYLEILKLKEKAAVLWGESYSDYDFHTFYLECGPASFAMLEETLQEYTTP